MTITQLAPVSGNDVPLVAAPAAPDVPSGDVAPLGFAALLGVLDAGGAQLQRAESAETAFANGSGDLQTMVFERAKADSLVSVAASTASRVAQSLNAIAQIQL